MWNKYRIKYILENLCENKINKYWKRNLRVQEKVSKISYYVAIYATRNKRTIFDDYCQVKHAYRENITAWHFFLISFKLKIKFEL